MRPGPGGGGIAVPAAFADALTRRCGDAGRRWLAAVPALAERLCDRWRVELLYERARHGHHSLVLPARQAGEVCVLKLCGPGHDTMTEATALAAWDGRGAVRLREACPEEGALLLERLDADRSLAVTDLFGAAEIAGDLIRRLTVPAPPGIPGLGDMAAGIAESVRRRQRVRGDPLPVRWVDMAARLATELAAATGTDLVHTDLHYGNILAGTRRPWLAVDPKAAAGDPERSVPELMWTRLDDAPSAGRIRALLAALTGAAALDPAKAEAWTVVRAVDYWLWGLDNGLTEDPVRCHRLLDALTG